MAKQLSKLKVSSILAKNRWKTCKIVTGFTGKKNKNRTLNLAVADLGQPHS